MRQTNYSFVWRKKEVKKNGIIEPRGRALFVSHVAVSPSFVSEKRYRHNGVNLLSLLSIFIY